MKKRYYHRLFAFTLAGALAAGTCMVSPVMAAPARAAESSGKRSEILKHAESGSVKTQSTSADAMAVKRSAASTYSVKTLAKKTSGKWKYKKKKGKKVKVSYRYKNGTYPVGIKKIGKTRYYFSSDKGKLVRGKKARIYTVNGSKYYVKKNGTVFSGWVAYKKKKLYYFSKKTGKMVKNKTVDKIILTNDGSAVWNLNASVRYKSVKLLDKITDRTASKSKQLKDAFYYIGNRRHFSYATIYPNLSDKSWAKKYANQMLSTRCGNCYGFACTFAAVAHAIGYKPYMVTMRIHGPRDHAADGYTRHCQVRINGYYYDPELHWYGGFNIYKYSSPGMSTKSRRSYSYTKMKGSIGAGSTVSGGTKKFKGKYITKKNGKYYYYSGKKKLSGIYYIDGSLYNFRTGMTQQEYVTYQKAIREGAPWEELKALIGRPLSQATEDSCYKPNGRDCIYKYKNIIVTTFRPDPIEEEATADKTEKNTSPGSTAADGTTDSTQTTTEQPVEIVVSVRAR